MRLVQRFWCKQAWLLKNSFFRKSAEIESRQDALQTIFSTRLDIFYARNLPRFLTYRVFQQPQAITLTTLNECNRDVSTVDGGRRGRSKSRATVGGFSESLRRDCCYGASGLGFAWGKCCPQNLTNQFPKASASSRSKAIGMRLDEQFKAISRPTSIASVRLSSMGPISDCSPERMNTRWIASSLALTRTLMSLLIRRSTGASTAVQL
jgi:hypothetical protein